jgi:hypothetical protein
MHLSESITISADAITVWPYLADPVLQADWNPKIVSVERDRSGPVRFGERFETIYRMSGRDNLTRVEVTVAQPSERVVFVHRMPGKTKDLVVEESYHLTAVGDGVKVVQMIDLSRAGIPWPFRVLMWLIHRFGWSTEEPYLERLRRLVERPNTASA